MKIKKFLGTGALILALVLSFSLFTQTSQAVHTNETNDTDTSEVKSITLSGEGENINWSVDGYSDKGFKVVWSQNPQPTYPLGEGDKYHYYTDPNRSSDTLEAFDGSGTYYVRVCEYLGGECGVYSNEITVELGDNSSDSDSSSEVKSISLSGQGEKINWKVDGYSEKGFKVVWSQDPEPTYPLGEGDKYHYYTDPEKRSDTLTAFDGDGVYYVRVCEYLGGKCGVYSNEIEVELTKEKTVCTTEYNPVCGKDGKTYTNKCKLDAAGVAKDYYGECKEEKEEKTVCTTEYDPVCGEDGKTYTNKCKLDAAGVAKDHYGKCEDIEKDEEIKEFEKKAELLSNDKLDTILEEVKELRSQVKEQQSEIKYLRSLVGDLSEITSQMESAINSFITYGVDDNTKRLGAGERAAVIHSFRSAYNKLPQNDRDLTEVIKIANGRWPSEVSQEAEEEATEKFEKIYKRSPNFGDPRDTAAIKVMAYGLRQKAENRNLKSEGRGIKIFKDIFNKDPQGTEDWNTVQAITYSGATR